MDERSDVVLSFPYLYLKDRISDCETPQVSGDAQFECESNEDHSQSRVSLKHKLLDA